MLFLTNFLKCNYTKFFSAAFCFTLSGLLSYSQNINTATNGLNKPNNSTVSLGGTLINNTSIDLGSSFTFKFSKATQDLLNVINNGNVGIGVTTPNYKLDVNGAVRIGSLSADPTGANGTLYYSSSLSKLRGYVDGGWKNFLMQGDVTGISSITTGYGLLGGIITNTGTISADSATLANYFIRKNDSLATPTSYTTLYQNSLKQNKLILTTNGTSGSASLIGSTLNIPSYSTGGTWGSITGSLSSQTDLQSSLDAKQNNLTLTTTGTSGSASLIGSTLNIPSYSSSPPTLQAVTSTGNMTTNTIYLIEPSSNYPLASLTSEVRAGMLHLSDLNTSKVAVYGVPGIFTDHWLNFPTLPNNRYIPTSVNGNTADPTGNITIPTGTSLTYPLTTNQYLNGYGKFSNLNTDSILEGNTNKFYSVARVRTAISLTTSGTSGPATYDSNTGILNVPTSSGSATPTLQQVTGSGNTTTLNINALSLNDLPVSRGGGNQAGNIALGDSALYANTVGTPGNIAIGTGALRSNQNGGGQIAIGYHASYNDTANTVSSSLGALAPSIAIGNEALYTNKGRQSGNIAIGNKALYSAQRDVVISTTISGLSGSINTAVGNNALQNTTGGFENTAIGAFAATNNTTGYSNTNVGGSSGRLGTTAIQNTYVGRRAGYSNLIGNSNTNIGMEAGYSNLGSGGIKIGYQAGYFDTSSNKLYISNSSTTTPLIYGDFAAKRLKINGTLEISGATGAGYVLTDVSGNGILSLKPAGATGGGTTINNDADNRLTTALGNGQFNAENNLTFDGSTLSVSGNIGIGTTTSYGYRLAVNGNALFTRVKVKDYTTWPDYVFDEQYKLPSLQYIEEFIKKYNHLPDVPSEDKINSEGLDIADNQALLLRKVEELTLYAIQQNKQIEMLQKEVRNLKKKGEKNK